MRSTPTPSSRRAERQGGAAASGDVRRGGPAALALAGAAFIAYPALRPYSDETTLAGAEAMASPAWVVSHVLGIAGFVLVALGIAMTLRGRLAGRRSTALAWLGAALVLPYYGAETFGLQVIAQHALAEDSTAVLVLAEEIGRASCRERV